jgi:hypothetical protein
MNIISSLQKFEKPDKTFLKDKECLICLESIDVELQKIVMLPCKCSNSVYHINCTLKLLESGENKNFCPHCKNTYVVHKENIQLNIFSHQVAPIDIDINVLHNARLKYIYVFHMVSNTIINITNVSVSLDLQDKYSEFISFMLLTSFFCKLCFNCYIIFIVDEDKSKIKNSLYGSYAFQIFLFILLIFLFSRESHDSKITVLLLANIIFYFGDLGFRIHIEYRT